MLRVTNFRQCPPHSKLSSSCKFARLQMAARQQPDRAAWGRLAEADAAWACTRLRSCTSPALLLVRLLQLQHPLTPPLAIHMCVPRHHGRRCKTKQRRCDENLLPLSLLPPHVHKCISELRIVVAPRKVHTHFGIFWQFPDYPPTSRCCYCNLEKLAASHCTHAGFVSLALSLSLSTNLPMYSAYVQGLQLNVLPQYIRSIYT